MWEITYSLDGLIRKIKINAMSGVEAQEIFTNMYGGGKYEIINVRKV